MEKPWTILPLPNIECMVKKRIGFALMTCFALLTVCHAQVDSTILTYNEYITNILTYHPLAKQANLRLETAKAEWLVAKGNLDPVLSSTWNQKNFDNKRYYRQFQSKIQIPTVLGIDFVGGYEKADGTFLNPENTTDEYGLWYAGVEVNLLQGLFVNERKTAIEQARIFQNLAKNEQQILLNELLYNASDSYIEWQKYDHFQRIINENLELANTYFENTKQSFRSGEKTAIDTLEAYILFQDAQVLFQKNSASLEKTRQTLQNYLWFNDIPMELQASTRPEDFENQVLQNNLDVPIGEIVANHPAILEKLNKQSYLEIEQKLKREKLKPKLKGKYNPLFATEDNLVPTYSSSDYKWGFEFSMPLYLRNERGNIQKGDIKLEEIALNIADKKNELKNKIENSLQQQVILQDQLNLLMQNVAGYKLLLDAENEKFRFGESSVFLLNKRQEKYINGQLKLIELNLDLQLEILNFLYYSNNLTQ